MTRYFDHPDAVRRQPARGAPATETPNAADPAWANAARAADELREELGAAGQAEAFVGLRVVRNVVGRPVVQLGTVEPDVARQLADLLRTATTRTLYIVAGAHEDAGLGPGTGFVSGSCVDPDAVPPEPA